MGLFLGRFLKAFHLHLPGSGCAFRVWKCVFFSPGTSRLELFQLVDGYTSLLSLLVSCILSHYFATYQAPCSSSFFLSVPMTEH